MRGTGFPWIHILKEWRGLCVGGCYLMAIMLIEHLVCAGHGTVLHAFFHFIFTATLNYDWSCCWWQNSDLENPRNFTCPIISNSWRKGFFSFFIPGFLPLWYSFFPTCLLPLLPFSPTAYFPSFHLPSVQSTCPSTGEEIAWNLSLKQSIQPGLFLDDQAFPERTKELKSLGQGVHTSEWVNGYFYLGILEKTSQGKWPFIGSSEKK